ncbi:MAG: transposase [Thermoguttaceae bacterium]
MPLILVGESGFNLFPNLAMTWAPTGVTPILLELPKRLNHSALGMISLTPKLQKYRFYFTVSPDSILKDDFIFWLYKLHRNFRKKIILVWDNIGGHKAAEEYFKWYHPDWFEFESFPCYVPELNPVESCWKDVKSKELSNYVSENTEELTRMAVVSAMRLDSDPELIKKFFEHAGIPL